MSVPPTVTDQLFNLDNMKIFTSLDEQHAMYPADFLTAVAFLVSFFLVFDLADQNSCIVVGHICQVMP